jgi:hypothetical protein
MLIKVIARSLITGRQLKAARALRRMESFEGEIGSRTYTLSLIQKALEEAGVEFLNNERPGARMRPRPELVLALLP